MKRKIGLLAALALLAILLPVLSIRASALETNVTAEINADTGHIQTYYFVYEETKATGYLYDGTTLVEMAYWNLPNEQIYSEIYDVTDPSDERLQRVVTGESEGHPISQIHKMVSTEQIPDDVAAKGWACVAGEDPNTYTGYHFMDTWGHWALSSMEWAYAAGYVKGKTSVRFDPNVSMTRSELAAMLYRAAGSPGVSGSSGFSDVTSGAWYAQAVTWASQTGVVNGTGSGQFSPNGTATREAFSAMLYRYNANILHGGDNQAGNLSAFSDEASVSGWSQSALRWALAENLLTGYSENGGSYLKPQRNISRAEVVTLLDRFFS